MQNKVKKFTCHFNYKIKAQIQLRTQDHPQIRHDCPQAQRTCKQRQALEETIKSLHLNTGKLQ